MEIPVNFSNQGPMISVLINNKLATCILNSGLTFTLIPFKLFQQMNIRPNNLNTSVIYNINSASHRNSNAVLESITLDIVFETKQRKDQNVRQKYKI